MNCEGPWGARNRTLHSVGLIVSACSNPGGRERMRRRHQRTDRSSCFRVFEGQRTLLGISLAPLRFEERKHHPVSGEPGFARHKTYPVGREVHTKVGRRVSRAGFVVDSTTDISCLCPSGKSPTENISTDLVASSIPARLQPIQLDPT
jgi:hypothetical protein